MNAWLPSGEMAWRWAGWSMLHYLWLGALVALAGALLRTVCRQATPAARYAVSLTTFAVLAVAPLGIAYGLRGRLSPAWSPAQSIAATHRVDEFAADAGRRSQQ